MFVIYDDCLGTTSKCIAAAERCAAMCGTSGDKERERCAVLARDCADVGRLVEALMLRGSSYAPDACALHALTSDAFADYCAKWPNESCCKEAMNAARACAVACRACAAKGLHNSFARTSLAGSNKLTDVGSCCLPRRSA